MHSFTNLALLASALSLCRAASHVGEDRQWKRALVSSSTGQAVEYYTSSNGIVIPYVAGPSQAPSSTEKSSATLPPSTSASKKSSAVLASSTVSSKLAFSSSTMHGQQPPAIFITDGEIEPTGTVTACSTITTTIGTRVDIIPIPCASNGGALPSIFTEEVMVGSISANLVVGPSGDVSFISESWLAQPPASTTSGSQSATSSEGQSTTSATEGSFVPSSTGIARSASSTTGKSTEASSTLSSSAGSANTIIPTGTNSIPSASNSASLEIPSGTNSVPSGINSAASNTQSQLLSTASGSLAPFTASGTDPAPSGTLSESGSLGIGSVTTGESSASVSSSTASATSNTVGSVPGVSFSQSATSVGDLSSTVASTDTSFGVSISQNPTYAGGSSNTIASTDASTGGSISQNPTTIGGSSVSSNTAPSTGVPSGGSSITVASTEASSGASSSGSTLQNPTYTGGSSDTLGSTGASSGISQSATSASGSTKILSISSAGSSGDSVSLNPTSASGSTTTLASTGVSSGDSISQNPTSTSGATNSVATSVGSATSKNSASIGGPSNSASGASITGSATGSAASQISSFTSDSSNSASDTLASATVSATGSASSQNSASTGGSSGSASETAASVTGSATGSSSFKNPSSTGVSSDSISNAGTSSAGSASSQNSATTGGSSDSASNPGTSISGSVSSPNPSSTGISSITNVATSVTGSASTQNSVSAGTVASTNTVSQTESASSSSSAGVGSSTVTTTGAFSTGSVSKAPTSVSTTSSAGTTSYPCYHIADPDSGQTGSGGCECSGYTNTFPLMPSTGTGAASGSAYQPCAYTSVPPLPSTSSTPTSTTPSSSSAVSNALPTQCTNGANPDASCFNALDLPDYLLHWWTVNQASCGQQGFAACFYAKNTKYAPSDCGQLNNDAACTEPVWNDFVGTTNGPENFYVAWNIWNTNGFFLDLYNAIGTAEGSASAGISAIVALLDPPKSQNIILNDVLDALTFGLSLYAEGSILVKALLRSMPQTAGLLGKLFPSGTVDGEYQDWAKVSSDLGTVTDAFRASVAEGLPIVENDVHAFITWSQNSGFSGFRPSLNGLVGSMTQALNTYCIAQIISSQGIVVSRAANTDVHALQTNGSQLNWDTGCSGGYTAGICDTFFWDGTDTYGLTDPENMDKSYHDELTSFFVGTPALTTGQLLFTGAQGCYTATQKNGGSSPSLDSTDPSSFSCLSSMQVCTWDETGYGPFDASCANLPSKNAVLPGFGVSGCIGSTDSTTSIDVPRAYLGPGVYQDAKNIEDLQVDSFCDNISYRRRRWVA